MRPCDAIQPCEVHGIVDVVVLIYFIRCHVMCGTEGVRQPQQVRKHTVSPRRDPARVGRADAWSAALLLGSLRVPNLRV
jgi:hypothetical protein